MKKTVLLGLATAALATAGFALANRSSRPVLTPSQLENIEALSDDEWWIEIEFDKNCVEGKDYCILSPSAVIVGIPRN